MWTIFNIFFSNFYSRTLKQLWNPISNTYQHFKLNAMCAVKSHVTSFILFMWIQMHSYIEEGCSGHHLMLQMSLREPLGDSTLLYRAKVWPTFSSVCSQMAQCSLCCTSTNRNREFSIFGIVLYSSTLVFFSLKHLNHFLCFFFTIFCNSRWYHLHDCIAARTFSHKLNSTWSHAHASVISLKVLSPLLDLRFVYGLVVFLRF